MRGPTAGASCIPLLLAAACVSPSGPGGDVPAPQIIEGRLSAAAPVFRITVGPAAAGRWRADLAHANVRGLGKTVTLVVRDTAGVAVVSGERRTPNFLTAQWNGTAQASYLLEVAGEDLGDLELGEIFTLQVTSPR